MSNDSAIPVLIGVGSNLCNPVLQVKQAIAALSSLPHTRVIQTSSLYQSLPQGPQDQDRFCNAVALVATSLTPSELLLAVQAIEQQFGRIKTRHWGERIIDLDILFYGQHTVRLHEPDLCIPHPHALSRDFVLLPALEICPDWRLPDGSLLASQRASCLGHDLQRIE